MKYLKLAVLACILLAVTLISFQLGNIISQLYLLNNNINDIKNCTQNISTKAKCSICY